MGYNPLVLLFTLLFKLSLMWPLGGSFWLAHMSFTNALIVFGAFPYFLVSQDNSRLLLCFLYPKIGITYFSMEPLFYLLEDSIWESRCVQWICLLLMSIVTSSSCQFTEVGDVGDVFAHTYIHFCTIFCHCDLVPILLIPIQHKIHSSLPFSCLYLALISHSLCMYFNLSIHMK